MIDNYAYLFYQVCEFRMAIYRKRTYLFAMEWPSRKSWVA